MTRLTEKEREARERVCLALDVPSVGQGLDLASELSDFVGSVKVNSLYNVATHEGVDIIKEIRERGTETFLDLKYHDTPNTVFNYARDSSIPGVGIFNVHIGGGEEMCKRAMDGAREGAESRGIERPRVVGVTVLTSLSDEDLREQGLEITYRDLVKRRAELAKEWGLDGIVCGANVAGDMEEEFGSDFLYVTPGLKWAGKSGKGQKQLYTPDKAVRDCSSSVLVIGSALRNSEDRRGTAYDILKAMAEEL